MDQPPAHVLRALPQPMPWSQPPGASPDLLVEHSFTLAEAVYDLEVLMDVEATHDLSVHAVQIVPATKPMARHAPALAPKLLRLKQAPHWNRDGR